MEERVVRIPNHCCFVTINVAKRICVCVVEGKQADRTSASSVDLLIADVLIGLTYEWARVPSVLSFVGCVGGTLGHFSNYVFPAAILVAYLYDFKMLNIRRLFL